ncbi:SRPBCC family protein [Flavobacterium pectinovorum]|uniref:Polyketide cyclase n=1 Tax=Flavobacterium pectinovorum TaxID=29533 RepID=A0A502ESV3_9FLAO|nr:SRPBCC family protein [Flavobacterium pectinovorum]TPG39929.1 polyketide cyclase [Flavobacterium pectinovorum]
MEKSNNITNRAMDVSRVLNAPVDLVWEVWTNPEHIANWWGPNGFTNTIHKMDLNDGGEWNLTMHGPDGKNYQNRSTFVEIVPFKKIVFQHYNPNYLATIIFESKENKTVLDWTGVFETDELYETVVKVFKADEGLIQNVDKLEEYLQTQIG